MIVLWSIIILLSFFIMAKVVDDYFIVSLDELSTKLNLSSNASGATLMAVGSSAPELFVTVFSVLKPGNHEIIGVGNIVGSAMFNLLAIIGATAIIRRATIEWRAVIRDLFFYSISILLLILFLKNGEIKLSYALIFIAVYIVYVLTVLYSGKSIIHEPANPIEPDKNKSNKNNFIISIATLVINGVLKKAFLPINNSFLKFVISIGVIALISWVLVECAINIAYLLNISETIFALTIMAAGTSLPDMLSSIKVAKQGRSNMAISNAIGSNIFDILIGLGLPFLIIVLLRNNPLALNTGGLLSQMWILLISVLILLGTFAITKWKVGKKMGIALLLLYATFVLFTSLSIF